MIKKIIALATTVCILFSLLSVSLTPSAVYYGGEALNGDADGNGIVDMDDVLLALQVASGIKQQIIFPYITNADIDKDGVVTISDARQILQYTAGLVNLQPSGAFFGFESSSKGVEEEEAIEIFNYYLNAIKNPETEKLNAGFTKTETQALYLENGLYIGEIEFIGLNLGNSVGTFTNMILEKLTESDADGVEDIINKGDSCYNDISVEGQTYVSQLTTDDVCGIRFNLDESTMIATVEVALYDTKMEEAASTGYGKVLDTERMVAASTGVLSKIIDYGTQSPVMTREFKNCVLKVEILLDQATGGRVVSYTVTYDEYAFIYEAVTAVGRLSTGKTKIKNTEMKRYHIIEYTNFQW